MEEKEMKYVAPVANIVEFNAQAIICTSGYIPGTEMEEGNDNW